MVLIGMRSNITMLLTADMFQKMMTKFSIFIYSYCAFVTILNRSCHTIATTVQSCDINTVTYMRKGIALQGETFWSTKTMDELECAKHCIKRRICQSFNFDSVLKLCELNEGILTENKPTRSGSNLSYSIISTWPSQIEPDCFDRPCEDDEVCIPTQFNGGTSCSHSCFKLPLRCPLPEGIFSDQSRTVGSTLKFTCERGYVGGDSAVCLASGSWDKDINTTCILLHGSSCSTNVECHPINGSCQHNTCQCAEPSVYDDNALRCIIKDCETDWIKFNNKCYLFSEIEMAYTEALTFCANYSSSLVQVDSSTENEFLKDMMRNTNPPPSTGYWNDLFQMTTNGNEIWRATGDAVIFSDWDSPNPDDYRGEESCTVFWISADYRWVDISCENTVRTDGQSYGYPPSRAVCEKYP